MPLSLRKWMKLFVKTLLIGALAGVATGVTLQVSDPEFRNIGVDGWLYNIWMMALSGMNFGALAHLGFFAYLVLNYVARSVLRRPYLWVALQGFTAVFVLAELVYWLSLERGLPAATAWVLPVLLTAAAVLVSWLKVRETTRGAWIPSLFFLIACTVIEAVPAFREAFREDNVLSIVVSLVPLFVCNAYQVMQLHRVLDRTPDAPAGEGAGGAGDAGGRGSGRAGAEKRPAGRDGMKQATGASGRRDGGLAGSRTAGGGAVGRVAGNRDAGNRNAGNKAESTAGEAGRKAARS